MRACVRACVRARARVCVCVCVCERARACSRACVRALRILSMDKILRFIFLLLMIIINYINQI